MTAKHAPAPTTCAFKSSEGSACQFRDKTEFTRFNNKHWCCFYLPTEAKSTWSGGEIYKFYQDIFTVVDTAKARGSVADLVGVVFPGDADFSRYSGEAKALPDISFSEATFARVARFRDATFGGAAFFRGAKFMGAAEFSGAAFASLAWFGGATFLSGAWFVKASFGSDAEFHGTNFSGEAVFAGATFGRIVAFSAGEPGEIDDNRFFKPDFRDSVFQGRVRFTNRRFLGTTLFRGSKFLGGTPEFHGCQLHQDTDFTGVVFKDRSPEAARAYRTLKLAMEQTRARDDQARFFAYEQECRQNDPQTPRIVRILSRFYGATADYGQCIWQPVFWLAAAYAAFLHVYLGALTGQTFGWAEIEPALRFAFRQVFTPFHAFREDAFRGDKVPLWLAFIAAVHSLLNFTFLTLFIVAVRRRFRIG